MYFQIFLRLSVQRKRLLNRWLLPLLVIVCANTSVSVAAGLGPLTLHSSLGQQLDAEIAITGIDAEDLETVTAFMASSEVFEQMGIPVPSVLQHIRFKMLTESVEGARVIISSVQPIREPFINLVVELSWAQGTYLREYTFLLDPVVSYKTSVPPVSGDPVAADNDANSIAPESNLDTTIIEIATQAELAVVVQRGANLLDIARDHTPAHLSVEQAAMAIYDRNPGAFFGSVHKLKRGALLSIPDFDQSQLRTRQLAQQILGIGVVENRQADSKNKNTNEMSSAIKAVALDPQAPDFEQSDTVVVSSVNEAGQAPRSAVLAASQSIGTKRRPPVSDQSVGALQRLIGELRGAMVGLGQELQIKTNQLDDISVRVDRLQQQAISTSVDADRLPSVIGSVSAIKAAPTLSAQAMSESPVPVQAPVPTDSPTAISSEAQATELAENAATDDSDALGVEPLSKLDQTEVAGSTRANRDTPSPLSMDAERSAPASVVSELTGAPPDKVGVFGWFFDAKTNKKVADRIRDIGLVSLALLLGIILIKRLFSSVHDVDIDLQNSAVNADSIALDLTTYPAEAGATSDEVSALSAIEYFREHLTSEQRKEQALKDTLRDEPGRQDVRLELLRVYHERGAVEMFAQTAREMYTTTQGKTPEWHTVIELGLALDADMSFYKEPEDHGFTLNEDFAVKGTRISSVSGGKSVAQRPSSQLHEDEQSSVKVRDTNHQVDLDEVVDRLGAKDGTSEVFIDDSVLDSLTISDGSQGGLDIDLEDDSIVKNLSSENTSDSADDSMMLDEAALDNLNWNESGADGLTDAELHSLSNVQDKDNDSTHDQIEKLDSIYDLDSVDGVDHAALTQELPAFPASEPAQSVSDWKENEVKLELAVVYIDMGNKDGAWHLLNDVMNEGDAAQIKVAQGLMAKLA